jgi:hypothetical protein
MSTPSTRAHQVGQTRTPLTFAVVVLQSPVSTASIRPDSTTYMPESVAT